MDSGTEAYAYNVLGQRVQKRVNWVYTNSAHDAFGRLIYHDTGTSQSQIFQWLGSKMIGYYTTWERYAHTNVLGSVAALTDVNGNLYQDTVYDPWGRFWEYSGTMEEYQFAGMQDRDTETGLDPTPNRMFSGQFGRWLTPDPAGRNAVTLTDPQTWNMYAYVRNNPTTLTDPSGLFWQELGNWLKYDKWENNEQVAAEAAQQRQWLQENVISINGVKQDFSKLSTSEVFSTYDRVQGGIENGRFQVHNDVFPLSGVPGPVPDHIEITQEGLDHTVDRHTPGGTSTAGKSLFSPGEDISGLIRSAESAPPVPQPGGNFERIVDAGRTIGVDRVTGQPTSTYTVITDAAGRLVTAFPGKP